MEKLAWPSCAPASPGRGSYTYFMGSECTVLTLQPEGSRVFLKSGLEDRSHLLRTSSVALSLCWVCPPPLQVFPCPFTEIESAGPLAFSDAPGPTDLLL